MNPLDLRDAIATTMRLARGAAPAAALVSGLLGPTASGAPGDLDPTFGDVGRLGQILGLEGAAWSLEALDDNGILLGGGDIEQVCPVTSYYCYYDDGGFEATGFASRLLESGSIDLSFNAASLAQTRVFDVVRQPDGKVVAVGQRVSTTSIDSQLVVFRLTPEGPMDTEFGVNGIVELSLAQYGPKTFGTSVTLDPDGRIVVAGSRFGDLIVLRLLADGALDVSFGTSGVYSGPESSSVGRVDMIRTGSGGYRVPISNSTGCQVVALTANGALDAAFGSAGIAQVDAPLGPSNSCSLMVAQPDGRLLVAGNAVGGAFAARLLAGGQSDPSFSANAVPDGIASATALALGDDGSVVVAGSGVSGATIMRLQATGELDLLFGNAGSTLIDLPSELGTYPVVNDMVVRGDGGVVAAGGGSDADRPFVIRLLGTGGGGSPGVLGVAPPYRVDVKDQDGTAVVTVRRTGGRAGQVSVLAQTRSDSSAPSDTNATAGEDYATTSRTLTWEDGDAGDKQIIIPILPDGPGAGPDGLEFFKVALSAVQGGAGLGTWTARVEIAADGAPAGQLSIAADQSLSFMETNGLARVEVSRDYYYDGAVSVTVSPVAGTAAAGDDFVGSPVTLTWVDGESGSKSVTFTINRDQVQEGAEQFSVQLSAPTGGAVLGFRSSASITILDSPPPQSHATGGGGGFGLLSTLLLGLGGLLRRVLRWAARHDCSAAGGSCE